MKKFFLSLILIALYIQADEKLIIADESDSLVSGSAENLKQHDDEVYPIVIIGSGPAGMSAAIYAARAKIDHVVIQGELGGQLMKASYLENWPGSSSILGGELAKDMENQTKQLGSKFIADLVENVNFDVNPCEIKLTNNGVIKAYSIIIATGIQRKKLKCPGEDKYLGAGIAVCAYCDAPLFQDKTVVVVGGGHSALKEIGIIKKYTNKITLINNTSKLNAPKMLTDYVTKDPAIKILSNCEVKEIMGDGQKATGVKIYNKATRKFFDLPADGIFIAIGTKPNSGPFKEGLKRNKSGEIEVDCNGKTSKDGVFAAGDVSDKTHHQAVTAAAAGYACAMEAEKYLCSTTECLEKRESLYH